MWSTKFEGLAGAPGDFGASWAKDVQNFLYEFRFSEKITIPEHRPASRLLVNCLTIMYTEIDCLDFATINLRNSWTQQFIRFFLRNSFHHRISKSF